MAASKSSGERAEQFAAAGEQQISGEQLRHLEKLAKERQQERFWSDFQAAQNDLTVADKMVSGSWRLPLVLVQKFLVIESSLRSHSTGA